MTPRLHHTFVAFVVLVSGACSRKDDDDGHAPRRIAAKADPATSQATNSPSATSMTAPTTTTTPAMPTPPEPECGAPCKEPDDCPSIPCSCEDGSIVNSQYCRDGCCLSKEDTCSDSCAKHDGPKGSWNEARDGKKTGAGCSTDSSCASKICLHGYCSKKCTSFGDCPPFWECAEGSSPFDKFCQKK